MCWLASQNCGRLTINQVKGCNNYIPQYFLGNSCDIPWIQQLLADVGSLFFVRDSVIKFKNMMIGE